MNKQCKKFQMDIVDYATGDATFLTPAKEKKLFGHLRQCADCRKKFFEYEHIWASAVADKRAGQPEFQAKMKTLLDELKKILVPANDALCQLAPEAKIITADVKVGAPAGVVWRCLSKLGAVNLKDLPGLTNLDAPTAYGAYGWLAKENKLVIAKDDKETYICLAKHERRSDRESEYAEVRG
ncbi:MAG TPA: winged helix-turn-helix domain-containing protein [Planctomycetota bacterium]|nr:winged helix-turn-helix domain-containing protein [Planctomycetota bacterium]